MTPKLSMEAVLDLRAVHNLDMTPPLGMVERVIVDKLDGMIRGYVRQKLKVRKVETLLGIIWSIYGDSSAKFDMCFHLEDASVEVNRQYFDSGISGIPRPNFYDIADPKSFEKIESEIIKWSEVVCRPSLWKS